MIRGFVAALAASLLASPISAELYLIYKGGSSTLKSNGLRCRISKAGPGIVDVQILDREIEGMSFYHWNDARRRDFIDVRLIRRFEYGRPPSTLRIDLFREEAKSGTVGAVSRLVVKPGEYELVSTQLADEEDGVLPVRGSCRFAVKVR